MKRQSVTVTAQERVRRGRDRALEQLGSVMSGGDLHDPGIETSVRLALLDYRLRYPACRATSAWLFYDGNRETKRIRGTPERVDVYCLFCRVLLVNNAVWQLDYTDRVLSHTTICALSSLAGRMIPGAPGTYRLPSDLSEDNMGRRIIR